MRHRDQQIGDHAGDQLVVIGLDTRAGHDYPASLDATPVGRIPREKQVRNAVRPVVVTVGPELQCLAPRNVIKRCLKLLCSVEVADFVQQNGLDWPVGIALREVIDHTRYEHHDMTLLALGLQIAIQPSLGKARLIDQRLIENGLDCGVRGNFCHVRSEELRGEKRFGCFGQSLNSFFF